MEGRGLDISKFRNHTIWVCMRQHGKQHRSWRLIRCDVLFGAGIISNRTRIDIGCIRAKYRWRTTISLGRTNRRCSERREATCIDRVMSLGGPSYGFSNRKSPGRVSIHSISKSNNARINIQWSASFACQTQHSYMHSTLDFEVQTGGRRVGDPKHLFKAWHYKCWSRIAWYFVPNFFGQYKAH